MLNKMNLWMGRIGSVLLDFILMTLSQNWVGVELVAKTRRDSNSLLITLKMYNKQFFSGMVNLQDQLRDTSYCIVDSKVPYHSHLVSL